MTRPDDRWIDLTLVDPSLADGLWDGTVPPEQLPTWAADLAALIDRARGPATAEELAAERETLAAMEAVLTGSDGLDEAEEGDGVDEDVVPSWSAPRRRVVPVRRLAAAKVVAVMAVVVLGVAAEAATGVVSAVLPKGWPGTAPPAEPEPAPPLPTTVPVDLPVRPPPGRAPDEPAAPSSTDDDATQCPTTVTAPLVTCPATAPEAGETDPGEATTPGAQNPSGSAAATGGQQAEESTMPTPTPADPLEDPPHGQRPPESPGQSGEDHGRPPGKPGGPPEDPGSDRRPTGVDPAP